MLISTADFTLSFYGYVPSVEGRIFKPMIEDFTNKIHFTIRIFMVFGAIGGAIAPTFSIRIESFSHEYQGTEYLIRFIPAGRFK